MSGYEADVVRLLGGDKALGIKDPKKPLALHKAVERGVPAIVLAHFKKHAGVSNAWMSEILGVSEKTFIAWQKSPRKNITPVSSDRLVRAAKIVSLAERVLESEENARKWLRERQPGLGNEVPQALLSTDVGAKQVEDLLLRMEHGFLA
jgi:putative toxin-antitoxin system antitoxin component (TIGR02293 family)